MAYLLKQKFNINELAQALPKPKKILVLEPGYYEKILLLKQLQEEGFGVVCAEDIQDFHQIIKFFKPDLAVISPHIEPNFKSFLNNLSEIRKNYQALPLLTVGRQVPSEVLLEIMSLGVTSHLDRHLTRPGDLILIIKTII